MCRSRRLVLLRGYRETGWGHLGIQGVWGVGHLCSLPCGIFGFSDNTGSYRDAALHPTVRSLLDKGEGWEHAKRLRFASASGIEAGPGLIIADVPNLPTQTDRVACGFFGASTQSPRCHDSYPRGPFGPSKTLELLEPFIEEGRKRPCFSHTSALSLNHAPTVPHLHHLSGAASRQKGIVMAGAHTQHLA